tara:strand:+ start:224 stop:664 length:441 start_codon:yes stop_codon:yes gene_type:complete
MRIPKTLLNDVRSLADRFENVVRADERKRLLAKFRAESKAKPVAKPQPLYPVTGLHGEPLVEAAPVPVKTVAHNVDIGPGHHRLLAELAKGYQAAPTMAGNLGFTRLTVVRYLSDLRKAGYPIKAKSTGRRAAGRYQKIYRLDATG